MKVLVACEESGRVRDEFLRKGHDAVSLDLMATSSPGPHRQEPLGPDVLNEGWDLVVAFPPCTDLSSIGASTWKRKQADGSQRRAFDFVKMIYDAPVKRVCIENPVGWMNTNWRKPDQIINPWQFGDPYTKRTCLWLRGLNTLVPWVLEKPDTEFWITGQRRAGRKHDNSEDHSRWGTSAKVKKERSKTFPGIAKAMADTWG